MKGHYKKKQVMLSVSARTVLISVFLPMMCLFIVINSYISYSLTINQLRATSIENTSFVIAQSRNYLDQNLENIVSSFLELDLQNQTEIDFCSVAPNASNSYQNYTIELSNKIDTIYFSLYEQLNSILIYTDINNTMLYKSMQVPTSYHINIKNFVKYSRNSFVWSYLYPDEQIVTMVGEKSNTLSILKVFSSRFRNAKGIIQFNLNPEYFINLLNSTGQLSDCKFLIMANNRIINDDYKNDTDLDKAISEHLSGNPDYKNGSFLFKQKQGDSYLVVYDTSNTSGWKIISLVPYKSIEENAKVITRSSIRNLIILLIISSLIISFFMGMLTKPIVSLAKKVSRLQDKNLDIEFESNSFIMEISLLNQGITHLLKHAKKLLADVKTEQEEKHKAEFSVLSEQINPHFLYNTLFSVKQLCDLGYSESAGNMVMALSNFYRTGIGDGSIYIKLKNEFELIKNYLEIFNQRLIDTHPLIYSINLLPVLSDCKIIRMTLQPLIENAIFHGLTCKEGEKKISVDTSLQNNDVLITIHDNGVGINPEKLNEIKRKIADISNTVSQNSSQTNADSFKLGIGIANVQKRLIMYYGKNYGIDIESVPNNGTTIVVRIPMVYPDKE